MKVAVKPLMQTYDALHFAICEASMSPLDVLADPGEAHVGMGMCVIAKHCEAAACSRNGCMLNFSLGNLPQRRTQCCSPLCCPKRTRPLRKPCLTGSTSLEIYEPLVALLWVQASACVFASKLIDELMYRHMVSICLNMASCSDDLHQVRCPEPGRESSFI